MKIKLFLPDFRYFVRNKAFNSEGDEHPVFYYEELNIIYFYKPIGNVLYCLELMKDVLPENITIDGLKSEFRAIQIPLKIDAPKSITGTIS